MRAPIPPKINEDDFTDELNAMISGSADLKDRLVAETYVELRRLARRYMYREGSNHTLQPTALVHEAYLRLVDQTRAIPENHAHFVAMAAQMMRRILINHALAKKTAKRGALKVHIDFDSEFDVASPESEVDIVAIHDALTKLESIDQVQATIVELRYFGGSSIKETAVALKLSEATVKREWLIAKAWFKRVLVNIS